MTATLLTFPVFRAFDSNGAPLAGGLLYSYQAGTTTPLATYVDQAGVTQNTNPVVLDSTGTANVWLGDNTYKLVLKDKDGVQQWSVDNIQSEQAIVNGVYTNLADTSNLAKGDALIGVKQPVSGSVATTQHAKNTERISVKDFGAKGDWNGSTGTDDTDAINTALAALIPGQVLHFPAPNTGCWYKLASTLNVTADYVAIEGDSKSMGIKYTGTGPAIKVGGNFFTMRHMLLAGNGGSYGAGASGSYGVQFLGAANIGNESLVDCTIQNFGSDGVNFAGGVYTIAIDKCTIQGNGGNGIASTISGTDQNGNALTVTDCAIYGNNENGIKWKAAALTVSGCVFEVNKGYGVDLTWGGVASSPLPSGFKIVGNYFENCLLGQINMAGSGGVYVNGGEIESNYMLMSNAAGGTGSATGPMGVAITATAFINAADSAYYGVRNVRIGKNTYSATGTSLAYTHVDGGTNAGVGAFDPSVIIQQSVADDSRYVNLGDCQYQKILKTCPLSGRVHCTGYAWPTTDKSSDIYTNGAATGYFELPFKAGDALWKIDLVTQQASSQSYTVTMSLETADSTTTDGFADIGISQTITNASGGTAVNSLSFGSVMYRLQENYKVRLKTVITMGATTTTMYVFDPIVTII